MSNPNQIGETNPFLQQYSDTCAIKPQQLILNDFGVNVSEDQLVQYSMDHGPYDGNGTEMRNAWNAIGNDVACSTKLYKEIQVVFQK